MSFTDLTTSSDSYQNWHIGARRLNELEIKHVGSSDYYHCNHRTICRTNELSMCMPSLIADHCNACQNWR